MPWFAFAPGSVLINVKLCSLTHLCYSKSCKLFFFEKLPCVICSNPLLFGRQIYIILEKYFSFVLLSHFS